MCLDHDPDTIDCTAWRELDKTLDELPRITQDGEGLRVAARDIVKHEGLPFARALLTARHIDHRLVPHLRAAIEYARRKQESTQ